MALMTVGAGALLAGRRLIGLPAAVDVDWVLWSAGTLGGLLTAVGSLRGDLLQPPPETGPVVAVRD